MKFYCLISVTLLKAFSLFIAELHARAKRTRGRSPIPKVIYPS